MRIVLIIIVHKSNSIHSYIYYQLCVHEINGVWVIIIAMKIQFACRIFLRHRELFSYSCGGQPARQATVHYYHILGHAGIYNLGPGQYYSYA